MDLRFRSIFYRREKKTIDSIEEYIEKVVETVKYLRMFADAVKNGEMGEIGQLYNTIHSLESEADNMRRRISEELCRGVFFAHLREDLLNFVEEIDNIADFTKDAVKLIVETTPSWDLLYFTFNIPEMDRYIQLCISASEKLYQSFRVFKEDVEKAKPLIREIENIEEEADELKTIVIKTIFREADNYRIIDLILVKEMITMLDNICDSAEDSSDILIQIIAEGYG
ncbi:MAG: DUF47 family protein [Aigarchaeota archaeon]|nr:DUF47 family protein [Aigarchaeota archaeon]MDW7986347.1 DUF47 family protein [Nitrososphaerota archaeon]